MTAGVLLGIVLAASVVVALTRLGGRAGGPAQDDPRSLVIDGQPRYYRLHLPPAYDGQRRLPLVIALHWAGGSAEAMRQALDLTAKADREDFVLAMPEGTGAFRSWNAGYCCGDAPARGVDDIRFIGQLIDELTAARAIDSRRVYVIGLSNGGMLAHRVGAALAGRVAGIAAVAGAIGGQSAEGEPVGLPPPPGQPVSAILVHGRRDTWVPYEGGRGSAGEGQAVSLPVRAAVDFWVRHNGCSAPPTHTLLAGGAIVREAYAACRGGAEVVLYTLVDGSHDWPGARQRWWRPAPHGFDATDVIWEFLRRHQATAGGSLPI